MKTITCTDDFIKYDIHVGETVKYHGKYYMFEGLSGYDVDNKYPINLLREIPQECILTGDPYIGKRFTYHGHEIEILQQNKNGTYSAQAYNKKGKKEGGRFALLKQDMQNLKAL